MWLRDLLELLDRNKQPSLYTNMKTMFIRQKYEQKVVLELIDSDDVKANRIEIEPYKIKNRFVASFFKNNLPKCSNKDLTISELKYLLNEYTVLELI
jgi:hypothetical protein